MAGRTGARGAAVRRVAPGAPQGAGDGGGDAAPTAALRRATMAQCGASGRQGVTGPPMVWGEGEGQGRPADPEPPPLAAPGFPYTITDALLAASCNVFDERCAYRIVTFGSECPRIC